MNDDRWSEVASDVRLALAHVSEAHMTGTITSFQALRREVRQGTLRVGVPDVPPWLHGERGDVSVIARTITMTRLHEPVKPLLPTHTLAIAEIDPPLFAGLRLMSRDLGTFYGFAKGDLALGHPALDARFLAYSFDYKRAREIFVPQGQPDSLGDTIASASQSCSIVVKDSTVETICAGAMPYADRIEALIEFAASIAREISARSRGLSHSAREIAARTAWHELASSLGLSVDPLRWHIFGQLGGVDVSAMLDGSPPAVSTTFRAKFRSRLPVALFLRRGTGGKTGFAELDGQFVLHTPQLWRARELFADPSLRKLVAEEGKTSNLVLDDLEIVLGRGGFAGTKEIAKRLQALVAIVDLLTPGLRGTGPFR